MNIKILVGIDDCTLMVYSCSEEVYYFSVVDVMNQIYTCNSGFPSFGSAKLMGTSAIKRLTAERD